MKTTSPVRCHRTCDDRVGGHRQIWIPLLWAVVLISTVLMIGSVVVNSWSVDEKAFNQVTIGMPKSDVIELLGMPQARVARRESDGGGERWTYRDRGPFTFVGDPWYEIAFDTEKCVIRKRKEQFD